jgi:hypothetical protein
MQKGAVTHLTSSYDHDFARFRLFIGAFDKDVRAVAEGTPQFFTHHTDSFR